LVDIQKTIRSTTAALGERGNGPDRYPFARQGMAVFAFPKSTFLFLGFA
jgi:hypothetical protein